jgi:lysophospholipase L1-like esterase
MTRWQITVLFFSILFILVVALLYFNRRFIMEKYYLWISYERAVSLFAADPITNKDVVFLGDSITESFPLSTLFPDVAIKNRGISGDTTAGVLKRLDQVTAVQPHQIFLMIGTNDLGFGYPKETAIANYDEILRRITQEAPDTQVFVQSILPRHKRYAADINDVNKEIASLAEKYTCVYVDLFPTFADEAGGIRAEFSSDDLHLSNAGYAQWQQRIAPFVYGGGGN